MYALFSMQKRPWWLPLLVEGTACRKASRRPEHTQCAKKWSWTIRARSPAVPSTDRLLRGLRKLSPVPATRPVLPHRTLAGSLFRRYAPYVHCRKHSLLRELLVSRTSLRQNAPPEPFALLTQQVSRAYNNVCPFFYAKTPLVAPPAGGRNGVP